jgi:hypothetical protein
MVNEGAWADRVNGSARDNTSAAKNATTAAGLFITSPSYCGGSAVDNLENAYWKFGACGRKREAKL